VRPADGLRLLLGATAHRSEGSAANRGFRSDENDPGLPGELFDGPNADTFASGRADLAATPTQPYPPANCKT